MEHTGITELQKGIDTLIGKFGTAKTVKMIKQLAGTLHVKKEKKQREELVYTFTISEAFKVFEVKDIEPEGPPSTSYKEARMAAYHIIDEHTDLSYNQIGKHFAHTKHAVYYHLNNCKEILSVAQFNQKFNENYQVLEQRVIGFIAKLD